MEKQYKPAVVEDKWYRRWLADKQFSADEGSDKPTYSIVIPPPNVTGVLHMGHALNNTIQDALIRFKHMSGHETLWMPGTDHAGIATQNVVERKLAKEGKTRHELGRAAFIDEVWKWKDEHRDTIANQLKKIGCACDWDRERFTMDEGLSRAVCEVFVRLHREGLIYRGKYIINWCPRCRTALSDEEAEHRDVQGKLYHFRYPYTDGSGHVTVATTRPETMLGDTAVAVNPKDERYADLVGKTLMLPLAEREIPVISDDFVDREFGTGAVKVTPAHDPNDFQMAQRHDLEHVVVIDESGKMCGPIPEKYVGKDRFECRAELVEDMKAAGLLEKIEEHAHAVGHCYRCHTVVEPYYSDQWFVKMQPLAEPALKAALDDKVRFYPLRWRKTYIDWMENIRDWCISRQIWWGHQIPAWYVVSETGGERTADTLIIVAYTEEQAREQAVERYGKEAALEQESDVLDTWFSSWLWPFSTMGWPDQTKLLERFYPTNTLVTAPEILFFWVARMIMAGQYCTGKLPFRDVVLHGTVRDKTGRKMSKSLGNAIDPLVVVDEYGADALRFSLLMITAQGADVYIAKDTFDIGRNFCNKLWNATRFLLGTISEKLSFDEIPPEPRRSAADKWILSRLQRTVDSVGDAFEGYRFNEACRVLYDFAWHDFCDWYVEAIKQDLYQDEDLERRRDALNICSTVLAGIVKLLHPLMPFITEELWSHLRESFDYDAVLDSESVFEARFPAVDEGLVASEVEDRFGLLQDIVVALRTIRAENNVPPDKKGAALLVPERADDVDWLRAQADLVGMFARLSRFVVDPDARKPGFAGQSVVRGNHVYLELEGLIDRQVEIDRLTRELTRLEGLVESARKRLESPKFLERAPQEVVAREKEKFEGLLANKDKVESSLAALRQ
ncbi:MAG: valine--tRNA ligase [Chitinivibrionales bacterium]|nr:valine--tRNA ligase [Chitinivibrionales bacterium]